MFVSTQLSTDVIHERPIVSIAVEFSTHHTLSSLSARRELTWERFRSVSVPCKCLGRIERTCKETFRKRLRSSGLKMSIRLTYLTDWPTTKRLPYNTRKNTNRLLLVDRVSGLATIRRHRRRRCHTRPPMTAGNGRNCWRATGRTARIRTSRSRWSCNWPAEDVFRNYPRATLSSGWDCCCRWIEAHSYKHTHIRINENRPTVITCLTT